MSASRDLATVLRHIASNVNWGGNQGEKAETFEALDRLTTDLHTEETRTADQVNAETPETPETPEEPNVGGGSTSGVAKKATGTRTPK